MAASLDKRVTHGLSKTRTYRIWWGMITRCTYEKSNRYYRYGGRGIRVCDKWMTFIGFYDDMGECPEGFSIERKDNDGNYEIGNVVWATSKDQANNRKSNRLVELNGQTKTLMQWCELLGASYSGIQSRLNKGVSPEVAFSTPMANNKQKLNDVAIMVIKFLYEKGFTQERLAKAHNISRTTIRTALAA